MTTDAQLISASLARDGSAFVRVVERHEVAIGGYLARRVGREVAEELLAEVWLAAFRSRSNYDRAYDDARPWLFGVAHNVLRRYWRNLPPEDAMADIHQISVMWDPWPKINERVDIDVVVRSALLALPLVEREVLTLVAWEDLTVSDAARTLGIPAGTARRHLHNARAALRQAPGVAALLTEPTTTKESR